MRISKALIASAVLTGLSVSSAFAEGTGPDYTTLTSGFDFTSTVGAIMAVGVGAVGLLLAMVGIKKVFQFVKAI
ncbi:hypothetical protein ATT74_15290 [Salmonella enterica subsp. enterica serovar Panama]|uniref:Phage coat protein n=1 Tax=Salmonella enterica subsp. enterica serovar Panama TaxID=29472 RepID=A0A619ABS7_SALET|nr:hypothetical protein [Salmonella enterica subsp. enterica serovar Panama]ECX3495437.1 hypothetical protein [Salmonella enterica subsp. enterica serovar Panama]ECX6033295.1 hypothetical protein [Salmonella enterica subsp. enterica serovar Panama]EGU5382109.1 hypothetical protein [Salmonella enterica]EGX1717179.1 hypothetical protein [Salmonella enterica subsp. enterica serovar Panama]